MDIIEKLGISKNWRFKPDYGIEVDSSLGFRATLGIDNAEEITPNIRLIATAPEMLEALIDEWKFIESYLASNASSNDGFWYNEFLNRQNIIKSKIIKAAGKSWDEIKVTLKE